MKAKYIFLIFFRPEFSGCTTAAHTPSSTDNAIMINDNMRSKLRQLARRLEEIDGMLADPACASDMSKFRALTKERADIEPVVKKHLELESVDMDISTAQEMLEDPEMKAFAQEEILEAQKKLEVIEHELQILLLPKDPNDSRNIFLEIRAGTGGDESALFAGDLLRMYLRYAEDHRWQTEIVSKNDSELGGYKEVIVRIIGEGAYSKLKFESGGHRVQRVPETETQGRIHTSTATVAVLPEADEVELEIDPKDLKIDTFRSSGAGGQHINKTSSAIRVTHLPTGTVVECQDERSQYKNKDRAMKILRSKLYEAQQEKQNAAIAAQRKSQVGTGDRSGKIRTYNFPQNRVTDHRLTGDAKNFNIAAVINGDLDPLVDALTLADQARRLQEGAEKGE